MKITLVGTAGGEVTGSCYGVGYQDHGSLGRLLVDGALAKLIQQRHRLPSRLPKMGEVIEL